MIMALSLEAKLEAILFWRVEPQSVKELALALSVGETEIESGLSNLGELLTNRGLRLIFKNDRFTLGTAPELGELFESLTKDELSSDLSRAGLETLTIILYRGPVAKSEVDYLRGVNSSFTLRHLLIRGLIEKIPKPDDARSTLYQPTFDLMSLLGLVKLSELPEYESIKKQLVDFLNPNSNDLSTNQ